MCILRTLFGTKPTLHLQPVSPFNKLSYSQEELVEQFHVLTSGIESEFVMFDETSLEVIEITYDE